jgi:hypothetical protein
MDMVAGCLSAYRHIFADSYCIRVLDLPSTKSLTKVLFFWLAPILPQLRIDDQSSGLHSICITLMAFARILRWCKNVVASSTLLCDGDWARAASLSSVDVLETIGIEVTN